VGARAATSVSPGAQRRGSRVQTLFVDVDRNKAKSFGIPLADVYQTVGTLLGSSFVNQFTAFGTNLKVKLQSEQLFRSDPVYLSRFYVRNGKGDMVPLRSWRRPTSARHRSRSRATTATVGADQRRARAGRSSGERLPQWRSSRPSSCRRASASSGRTVAAGKTAGGQAGFIFCCRFIFVFLFLAALYESFSLPVAVFLIVPIGILGALVALFLRHAPNDVFFQSR